MGNIPPSSLQVPNQASNRVTISTRSDPAEDYRVTREVGIVVSNSSSFRRQTEKEATRYTEAFDLLGKQCASLGGNAVLGTQVEIKQFGDSGTWMVVSCTGTACVVSPK